MSNRIGPKWSRGPFFLDISQLLKDICQDAAIISAGKSISIENEIQLDIKLTCNKELMTRLMWNLIDNVIKYNKEKGSIRISLGSLNQDVRLQITDSGIGIRMEEIQHIFSRAEVVSDLPYPNGLLNCIMVQ